MSGGEPHPFLATVGGVLDPHGPIAGAERLILINATGIMLVVAVPVIAMTLLFAWWFRAGNARASYRPEWSYSGQIELVVWAIPAMVVILLAAVGWTGSHELDPARRLSSSARPLPIQVVSLDWKWLFIYPGQRIATVNQLFIPIGTPLEFELTSATVMNDFFVPQLGSQIYTMPGMTTRLNLLADRAGDYPGFSAHFSGDGFSDMRFTAHALSPADYQAWLEKAQHDARVLDADALRGLEGSGVQTSPDIFRDIDASLYEQILQRVRAP
jgi:cytochrome o ubiquinol oxidase subunit II